MDLEKLGGLDFGGKVVAVEGGSRYARYNFRENFDGLKLAPNFEARAERLEEFLPSTEDRWTFVHLDACGYVQRSHLRISGQLAMQSRAVVSGNFLGGREDKATQELLASEASDKLGANEPLHALRGRMIEPLILGKLGTLRSNRWWTDLRPLLAANGPEEDSPLADRIVIRAADPLFAAVKLLSIVTE